jgi:hypothetical protein
MFTCLMYLYKFILLLQNNGMPVLKKKYFPIAEVYPSHCIIPHFVLRYMGISICSNLFSVVFILNYFSGVNILV